jgi:hypothetical protein
MPELIAAGYLLMETEAEAQALIMEDQGLRLVLKAQEVASIITEAEAIVALTLIGAIRQEEVKVVAAMVILVDLDHQEATIVVEVAQEAVEAIQVVEVAQEAVEAIQVVEVVLEAAVATLVVEVVVLEVVVAEVADLVQVDAEDNTN